MDDLSDRIKWVDCPRCNKTWNNLTPSGICVACFDQIIEDDKRQRDNGAYLLKAIGTFGLERYRFDNFIVTEENRAALEACKNFDSEKQNLYLFGPCGIGKTHLAGSILKHHAALGRWIKWVTPIYLGRGLRGRWAQDEEPFIDDIAAHDVLVIDDVGVGRDTHVILQAVYEIMEKRRNKQKNGLVLTSNHNLGELTAKYGDDRLSSRISGMCRVIQIAGTDRRSERYQ